MRLYARMCVGQHVCTTVCECVCVCVCGEGGVDEAKTEGTMGFGGGGEGRRACKDMRMM